MISTQVLIVGGGPAGAACAWQLKKHNISTLIIDRQHFPRYKPCAGWITPQVLNLLKINANDYPHPITHFSSFQIAIKKIHFTLPTHQFAIRRFEFDEWLLQRADTEIHQHQVKEIKQEQNQFILDDSFSAPYLVGAGGTFCPVRRNLFPLDTARKMNQIVAMEEEFQYPTTDDRCHLWFLQNGLPGYSWYVPKSGGYVNIGIGGKAARLESLGVSIKDQWQMLVEKIDSLGLIRNHTYQPRGHSYYLAQKGSQIYRDGVYLIGDSAGLATKDMGEGIGPAIQSGILAANAIIKNMQYKTDSIPKYSFPSLLNFRN